MMRLRRSCYVAGATAALTHVSPWVNGYLPGNRGVIDSARTLVSWHGDAVLQARSSRSRRSRKGSTRREGQVGTGGIHHTAMLLEGQPPPNPLTLLSETELTEQTARLMDWWQTKRQVWCLTGAGLSTESGIPDYRGYQGSYHRGHKPMVHDHFMSSEYQRKRYWGRGMVGWRMFDRKEPSTGHHALAELERMGRLGVVFDDHEEFYDALDQNHDEDTQLDRMFGSGQRELAVLTQNVDSLHRRAGSQRLIELHGRADQLKCMNCGFLRDRTSFHQELEVLNGDWLETKMQEADQYGDVQRPDGDAAVKEDNYDVIQVPNCRRCGTGFFKPDVVFFGDSVPAHRVAMARAAVEACDGLLVVGTSLAVHSAYRHVRSAALKGGTDTVAILNVGTTRAELDGLNVVKIEAPAGPTLAGVVAMFSEIKWESQGT